MCIRYPHSLTIGRGVVAFDDVQVVSLAEQSGVQESELLARGELAGTGVAGETRQMIHPFPGPPHPVASAHTSTTFRAFSTERSENCN